MATNPGGTRKNEIKNTAFENGIRLFDGNKKKQGRERETTGRNISEAFLCFSEAISNDPSKFSEN